MKKCMSGLENQDGTCADMSAANAARWTSKDINIADWAQLSPNIFGGADNEVSSERKARERSRQVAVSQCCNEIAQGCCR